MNAEIANAQPTMMLHLEAAVSPNTRVHVSSSSLNEIAAIMAHFNLVTPEQAQGTPAAEGNGAKAPARRKTDPKPETPASTATAPAATPQETAGSAPVVTPQQAAEAVRAYGAKNGIDAAKALMAKHGVDKTANITAEKAGAIHAEATAAQEL